MATDKKDIELRSEKVRNIVGKVPPLLLRIGIAVISLVIILFIIGSYFMPYPETVETKVKISSIPTIELIRAPRDGMICLSKTQDNRISKDQKLGYLFVNDSLLDLISPVQGKVIANSVNENFVEQGDLLFAIVPDTFTTLYCRGNIPGEMMHKIKIGQRVDAKIANKSIAHGHISQLYPLPVDTSQNLYRIDVLLEKWPSYNTTESFFQSADAIVYISNKSVLSRFLESVGIK